MNAALIITAVAIGVGLFLASWSLFAYYEPLPPNALLRLESIAPKSDAGNVEDLREAELRTSFLRRVIRPALEWLGSRLFDRLPSAESHADLEHKLNIADGLWGLNSVTFYGAQIVFLALLGLLALLLGYLLQIGLTLELLLTIFMAAVGFKLPGIALDRKVNVRQRLILKGLPNALDLLVIGVEAGLSLDVALQQVAEKFNNPLSREITLVLNHIRLGKTRREALLEMDQRIGLEAVSALVDALLYSEQMGTSLGQTLRIQAEEVRRRRRQRAQETGAKAPVKMLLPMVGCIFPSLFVVLLGPALLKVIKTFGAGAI